MPDRVQELIRELHLAPHPEGGHYREVFRSSHTVAADGGRGDRSAITTIFFLLGAPDVSRWHAVASDEVWHLYEGGPLELLLFDEASGAFTRRVVGSLETGHDPVVAVPAEMWQAARPLGPFALVGCSVGPGFDFADFRMMRDDPATAATLRNRLPDLAPLL